MCLLIMLTRTHADAPLIIGANRDERLDRPATPMTVLRPSDPRILGGRDDQAGGTWLAVNQFGVVAGLTNRPMAGQTPDPGKRSRGELPLALAQHRTATEAVDAFVAGFRPPDYNPAWLLVGDRDAAFGIDMTGTDVPVVHPLGPGVHILENRPVGSRSPKTVQVRRLLGDIEGLPVDAAVTRVQQVLADHDPPEPLEDDCDPGVAGTQAIPLEYKTACVHASEQYGTRWSGLVKVPAARDERPVFLYADGPPCTTSYRDDAGASWAEHSQ